MSVAARAKPSIGGALVLLLIATVPWVEQHRHRAPAPMIVETRAPVIISVLDTPDVIVPAHIRDAEPYPVGMVMGMNTPSVDPGILVWDGSPLANVLSVILAPWRALAGLRGT